MRYRVLIAACVAVLTFMGCTKEIFTPTVEIDLNQSIYSSIEGTATIVAHVTDDGGELDDAGICYTSNGSTPDVNNGIKRSVGASKDIRVDLAGLSTGDYRVRAYASNRAGTAYSDVATFSITGATIPAVTLGSCTYNASEGTATLHGTVTSTGGATVTQAGFVYLKGTSGTPTTANIKVLSSDNTNLMAQLSNLSNGTYRVRAFATNSYGTSYSSETKYFTINRSGSSTHTLDDFLGTWSCAATSGGSSQSWTGATITNRNDGTYPILVSGLVDNGNGAAASYFYALGNYDANAQCIRLIGSWYFNNHDDYSYHYYSNPDTSYYAIFYPVYKDANNSWHALKGPNGNYEGQAILRFNSTGQLEFAASEVASSDGHYASGYSFLEVNLDNDDDQRWTSIFTNLVMTKTSSSSILPPAACVGRQILQHSYDRGPINIR